MKIKVLTVGKIKEKYLNDGINEYAKRLSRYCKLEIVEVKDEKTKENASIKEDEAVKAVEGDRLLKYIDDDSYVIALAIDGAAVDSLELADKINSLGLNRVSNITFVIGGSLGLDSRILKRANFKLSFSKMTFPHQLMRMILLEQIYRSYRIINNEPYHK